MRSSGSKANMSSNPPYWPPNLPDAHLYPNATFAGLKQWMARLPMNYRLIVLDHVFHEDGNRTLSDWEYLRILPVQPLYDAYLAVPEDLQDAFEHEVRCTSAPGSVPHGPPDVNVVDAGALPTTSRGEVSALMDAVGGTEPWSRAVGDASFENATPETSGYCYLRLVTEANRSRFAKQLRRNPWAPALAAALLFEPGVWASGKFTLIVGGSNLSAEGPNYTQSHVVPHMYGCKISELIPRLCGTMRVGMATSDLNALMNVQKEMSITTKDPAFDERPDGVSMVLEVGVYGMVGTDQVKYPNFRWNMFSTPLLVAMFGIYESVRLESAKFTIEVDKGASNVLWCAIAANTDGLKGNEWHAAPVKTNVSGSDMGPVRGTFELPADSPFAREVRTRLPGNPPPTFNFGWQGGPGATGVVSGRIRVRCAGQAVMGFVQISGDGSTKTGAKRQLKALRRDVRQITSSLGYEVQGSRPALGDDDDEDTSESEDEDEPAAASRPVSPTQVRTTPPRSAPAARSG